MTGGVFEDAAREPQHTALDGPVTQECNVLPYFPDGLCLGDTDPRRLQTS